MKIVALLRVVLVFSLCVATPLFSEEQGLLRTEDVRKVMNQIFSQHVQKREISVEIIRNSFKVYINQFDPERMYLLDSDVRPFLNMSDSEVNRILQQYKRNDFSTYERLNTVIQLAIKRAQEYRSAWMRRQANYFGKSSEISLRNHGPDDTYSRAFAKTPAELRDRINVDMMRFIDVESEKLAGEKILNQKLKLMQIYDRSLRDHENKYLFIEVGGSKMAASQKENILTMHIIKSLAKSLDTHTTFFNQNEAYDMRVRLEKGFDGIGIVLSKDIQGYRIVKIIAGSPAETSGRVALDDYLLKVNGEDVDQFALGDVMKMLRGKSGTSVSLELLRESEDRRFIVKLSRAPIVVNEGRVELSSTKFGNGVIGTIKLHSFYQGANGISSEKDVRKAIEKLQQEGNIKGLVLDLRDNSGGFLTQAVKVAGLFITNGVIVVSKYNNGEHKFYRDMDGKVSYEGPLVVLTSRATASAAEIVAQALQDYGVALVVGDEHTYGKGTIQSQTVTNDDGGSSYFKVTVGKYYTVSGKTPEVHGVKADIIVPTPYSLEQLGEEYVDYPIDQDRIADSFFDSLNDIDPGLRPWYLRYYMPTLQKKTLMWHEYVPKLRKKSESRLLTSGSYHDYLDKGRYDDDHEYEGSDTAKVYGGEDPQLHEAVNIVKDMIVIESDEHRLHRLGVTDVNLLPN